MKNNTVSFLLILTMVLITMLVFGCQPADEEVVDEEVVDEEVVDEEVVELWKIGTAGPGGVFYFLGSAMGEVASRDMDRVVLTSEATAGSVENVRRVNAGELELALTTPRQIIEHHEEGMTDPEKVKILGSSYFNMWHVISPPGNPIYLNEHLKPGMDLASGEPGSGNRSQALDMLKVFNIELEEMNEHQISQAEAADALLDGIVDIGMFGGGLPLTAAVTLSETWGEMTLHTWTEEEIDALRELDPTLVNATVPANTYTGVDYDTLQPAWAIPIIVRGDLDENLVYEVTKALYENSEALSQIHPAGADFIPENAMENLDLFVNDYGLSVHPGAEKYYREVGVWDID